MDISEQDYQQAVKAVRDSVSGSVSKLQRKLGWGYSRAAAAIDRMQEEFIVSPMSASGRRDVYPSCIHQLWKELQEAKGHTVPEGFVLVPRVITDEWLAVHIDSVVAEYCKSYEDLPFSVEESELPEIRENFKLPIRNAHKRLMQVIESQETIMSNQVCIGRHINGISINPLEYLLDENGEVQLFANEAAAKSYLATLGMTDEDIYWMVFKAPEKVGLKVGDKVEPKNHEHTLASGACRYDFAYVVNINPFQLMSEAGDMYWKSTVEESGFRLIQSNTELPMAVRLRMIKEGLIDSQEQNHE